MKKCKSALMLSVALGLCSLPAFSEEVNSGFYLGAKVGKMNIDVETVDDPTSKGFLLGYDFGGFAIELERNTAEADWEIDNYYYSEGGTLEIDTTALYGVYRTQGTVYFKARAGVLREEVGDNQGTTETDNGFSGGIGIGARAGHFSFEGEYTLIETDIDLFSLGVNFTF